MIRLSVNINKIATLRNSRGGSEPRVVHAMRTCLDAGAQGITVHPRADRRHITPADVREIAAALDGKRPAVEYNIEGDPRDELLSLMHEVRPDQCTLVPVAPGETTSQGGWSVAAQTAGLGEAVRDLKKAGIRVSLFVDAEPEGVDLAASLGADRIELFTEPFARAFAEGPPQARTSFERYAEAASRAHAAGLGVNAGHDLDLDNLVLFRELPHLDEVSIGHAIVSRAVFSGLGNVVRQFLDVLKPVL
jgi:pyridoxine 5-phosphate synthase